MRRNDAINQERLNKKLHERGCEKKQLWSLNRGLSPEVRALRTEHADLTKRLKNITVTLPTIPPRREP